MNLKQFKKLKLLDKPGVYFFKKASEILYIGKATSLRDRVKSYFGKDLIDTRGPVILDMVFKADTVKWTQTDSVLEALILEAELIKKYQPKYNTKEKSDKSFNFVCITKETKDDLPKVIIKRGRDIETEVQKFSRIFGPYPNGSQLKLAVSMIRKIFPFLDDKSKNYAEFYRQIGLVPDLKDKRMYLENIKNINF
ncbi:MAG: GIY-YIG nuclease family protein [Patescibacteria group bacterium]